MIFLSLSSHRLNVTPDIDVFSIVMRSLANSNRGPEALALLETMKVRSGPDAH